VLTHENQKFDSVPFVLRTLFAPPRPTRYNNYNITLYCTNRSDWKHLSVLQENTESVLSSTTSTYRTRRTSCSCHQRWVTRTNSKWRNSRRPGSKPITRLNSWFARTALSVNSTPRYLCEYYYYILFTDETKSREIEIIMILLGSGEFDAIWIIVFLRDACPISSPTFRVFLNQKKIIFLLQFLHSLTVLNFKQCC